MKLAEKKKIVDELKVKFSKSKVVIVTDYKGLDVTTINSLRRELRESQVETRLPHEAPSDSLTTTTP